MSISLCCVFSRPLKVFIVLCSFFKFGDYSVVSSTFNLSVSVSFLSWVGYEYPEFQGQQFILEKGDYPRYEAWSGNSSYRTEHLLSFRPIKCAVSPSSFSFICFLFLSISLCKRSVFSTPPETLTSLLLLVNPADVFAYIYFNASLTGYSSCDSSYPLLALEMYFFKGLLPCLLYL